MTDRATAPHPLSERTPHTVPRNPLPALHIRPDHGWLNDPNGMVHHGGRWHVFFQHNPQRPVHERIAWGHVSSADLVGWDPHPVGFAPEPGGPDRAGCWSGVFLPWLDRPAMAYSGVVDDTHASTVVVREALDDDLDTWTPPYVVATTPPDVTQMRDPFCFERAGRRFALLGARVGRATPAVLLFSCDDPRDWHYEGVWLTGENPVAATLPESDFWECPQLVELGGRSVLVLSLQLEGRLSTVGLLVGDLTDAASGDGLPRFEPAAAGLLDEGPSCYAPQVALDPDGPWLHGWVLDVGRPDAPAPAVSGCLTLPRRLHLVGDAVVSRVDDRLGAYVGGQPSTPVTGAQLAAGVDLPLVARVTGAGAEPTAALTLRGAEGDVEIHVGATGFEVWVDADVVEVYRETLPPVTVRQPGTAGWRLRATGGPAAGAPATDAPAHDAPASDAPITDARITDATITEVVPPTPAAPAATPGAAGAARGR